MKTIARLLLMLFSGCGLAVLAAREIGHQNNGLSFGYQVEGHPCTIELIDTNRPSASFARVNKGSFCLYYRAWSPDHRYAALTAYPNGLLSIVSGQRVDGWQKTYDFDGVTATQSSFMWSDDSQQLAFLTGNQDLTTIGSVRIKDGIPSEPRLFTINGTQPIPYSAPAWSPDGQFIAFAAYTERQQGTEELFVLDVQNGESRRLTNNAYRDDSPSWSPDGTQLVFTSSEDGYNELHIINVATGERHQLTRFTVGYVPNWSPDGKSILFMSNMDHGSDMYIIGANGTGLRRLTYEHYPDTLWPIWLFPQE